MKLYPLPSSADKEAMDTAHRMRALLAGDIEERTKAAAVKKLNSDLSMSEQLLPAWSYLSSGERRAWKTYCNQG